ncbi:MAG TPA: hypothetical protein VLH09_02115, partial [Bryobacteraceae bacterium]|nr:hypothetical protein [Bryobacteraceae bacterium]
DESLLHAADYYEDFPWEPSVDPSLDIDIDRIERVEGMTLTSLLDKMIQAGKQGQTELMIATHGSDQGLYMRVAPGNRYAARRDTLESLSIVVDEYTQGNDEELFNGYAQQLGMEPDKLKRLVEKILAVRGYGFQRLEFRACFMGQDVNTLFTMRTFFGAAKIVAPTDRTLYGPVDIEILEGGAAPPEWTPPMTAAARAGIRRFRDRTLYTEAYFRAPTPSWRLAPLGQSPFGLHLDFNLSLSQPPSEFTCYVPRQVEGEPYFTLAVREEVEGTEDEEETREYRAYGAALGWPDVEFFVKRHILFDSDYSGRRIFHLAAFWTYDDLGPDLPYLLPTDHEYRERLRSDP